MAMVRSRRRLKPLPGKIDRKSTRLNSHSQISYAVFCLKKKNIRVVRCAYHGSDMWAAVETIPFILVLLPSRAVRTVAAAFLRLSRSFIVDPLPAGHCRAD